MKSVEYIFVGTFFSYKDTVFNKILGLWGSQMKKGCFFNITEGITVLGTPIGFLYANGWDGKITGLSSF